MSTAEAVRIATQQTSTEEEQGRLKTDLQYLRRRGGAFKASGENLYQGRKCARCGVSFGRFYNTGASCPRCKHRVCRQCREIKNVSDNNKGTIGIDWLCAVCHKIAELHAVTGEWMFETSITQRTVGRENSLSPLDILKHSIRRAWTINGPPAQWPGSRNSPEFRIYRSLPIRHPDFQEDVEDPEPTKISEDSKNEDSSVSRDDGVKKDLSSQSNIGGDKSASRTDLNERTNLKRNEKSNKPNERGLVSKTRKQDPATLSGKSKTEGPEVISADQVSRVSLLKPPRLLSKFNSPELKPAGKHGEKKSNIPIFRRSSKEFEDIRSPQESPKRSLIPQRYRGSTDDLRRSREDISIPSFIPKLLSPRNKEEKLKRQDSKDDIRHIFGTNRRQREETKPSTGQTFVRDDVKTGIRFFRRESKEDVGRESATTITNSCLTKERPLNKEELQEWTDECVGETTSRSKCNSIEFNCTSDSKESAESECIVREGPREEEIGDIEKVEETELVGDQREDSEEEVFAKMANELTQDHIEEPNLQKSAEKYEGIRNNGKEEVENEGKFRGRKDLGQKEQREKGEYAPDFKNLRDTVEEAICANNYGDVSLAGDKRITEGSSPGKKTDDFQVIRRKFSKEEFSNPDDPDEIPNRRCSSHLSPEASPLSTRSSRYSPRESESEPTPALPRKTGSGDSSSASQRIRDTITRTRRESNSSARYESSGSESMRLGESGLHGYADIARRVKFFGGSGLGPSTGSCDEVVQRDSATSAGEDEPHEDGHTRDPSRTAQGSSQSRTMLRRRRQFDAQGSRRRGRSHARTCCGDELQNLQALHVIGRGGGRQTSPPGPGTQGHTGTHSQSHTQDSLVDYRRLVFISSDSSSGREEDDADSSCSGSSYLNGLPRGGHAQGLEDCDWDYFESGTLPLPSGIPLALNSSLGTNNSLSGDWSCCPGRGSSSCQACGGSRGANVLPVPVPIPVPVPYPVPIPAALWTSDLAAASMITRDSALEGTLRLRGDPSAPWFAWHPRFSQHLHGSRLDPRLASFDPAAFGFRPEQISPRFFGTTVEPDSVPGSSALPFPPVVIHESQEDPEKSEPKEPESGEQEAKTATQREEEEEEEGKSEEDSEEDRSEKNKGRERMYRHSRGDSGSSSGRSSADSSDLEDSASHRFSRVFVVNDDSLTSDNDIEDNEDSDSAEGGVTLKRVSALPEEEPVVLRCVRLLNEDTEKESEIEEKEMEESENDLNKDKYWLVEDSPKIRKGFVYMKEAYVADSKDCLDCRIELKSIKSLDPESFETKYQEASIDHLMIGELSSDEDDDDDEEEESLDEELKEEDSETLVIPDSLEISQNLRTIELQTSTPSTDRKEVEISDAVINTSQKPLDSATDSSTSETNTTGSEMSSDELHEYELTPVRFGFNDKSIPRKHTQTEEELTDRDSSVAKEEANDAEDDNGSRRMDDIISSKISEIFQNVDDRIDVAVTHDESEPVRGKPAGARLVGDADGGGAVGIERERFRSVERRPPTLKENGFPPARDTASDEQNYSPNNKYRSLVMITQGTYQPVSVITSDTTTLLQPDEVAPATAQGLAGYFQLALEAVSEPRRANGQGPRKPLMVKRFVSAQSEPEVDSGLSVGSASESEEVQSVKSVNKSVVNPQVSSKNGEASRTSEPVARVRGSSSQSSDENSQSGVVILEEGLADDDSWVEEVSHDEDEQSATTATEESSEDEANNLGDREEELRGYHRQAIDFTLHTIVEESCEESEAEPNFATGQRKRMQRPPSASELEKYFFFGLGGDGNMSCGSREVDSLSETSSIHSEGLESLGQDEASNSGHEKSGESINSSRLEKYFLSEFLGFDQDRRDSDGSVGSDSEGRPSPEAQRRKRLVRARGTGRSHSSSLDNLLALAQNSQNPSSQNSLQDLSLGQDGQESQSEGSSTETDGAEEGQPAFGTDGQFDTVKRKKKKPRNLGTQSPRVPEDRNKTPEPGLITEFPEGEMEAMNSDDERAKTPQPENVHSLSSNLSSQDAQNSIDSRSKQQSRDSGFVGSCDDLLQHQKSSTDGQTPEVNQLTSKDRNRVDESHRIRERINAAKVDLFDQTLPPLANASLSRKDSFNNWSSDEETNLMMSKMRQFFKTMVANSNGQGPTPSNASSAASPAPSPRLSGYTSKIRHCPQNRTKPPQLVYFENELTRLMKTVPGIRDEQVREIVEYLSSEDTWSDSYDSSDYTSSDLEGAAGGRRSALQEQISQSCQQIISKFDTNLGDPFEKERNDKMPTTQPCLGRDTAFVYQKLVQSFTKMAGDTSSDASSTPHSSPPLIAKVMHHIGSRLVALMHEVSEGGSTVQPHASWRRYSQHHRTPSSASTTEDDESTSDSTNTPSSQLPRSKSHDPLLLINGHPNPNAGQEGEEREASDYERFSWRGSFESALMAADSRTKLSLLACSGDVSASASASALAMAAKRRSAGDLLFNPKSFSREQLDRVRSCGSIGGGTGGVGGICGGSIEEKIWSNRRRSSVPDANTRGESGASAGDEDTEDELEYGGDSRATTLPRGMQAAAAAAAAATNSLPRLPASTISVGQASNSPMHKAHSVYHFLPQHSGVKSARYRPPGFARNSGAVGASGPKRAVSAPGLQLTGTQSSSCKRETSRSRRQQAISITSDDGSSLSEACSTPIIGAKSRTISSHAVMDMDDIDRSLHSGHLATRASLSSLGARSDSMASVYSGAGEGRWCGSVAVRGEVEFALQYDYKQLTFEVHVTQCRDLAPVDVKRNRSDPYVKVYLLPDKSKSGKRKTKVKKHTLNPVFDETLKFHMSLNGLEARTLWLTVWHSDMFGRNDFLGEVRMPLENKIFDDPRPQWYPLQERTEPFDDPIAYKGEVIVGLKFVPPDPAQQERERETGTTDYRGKHRKNWSRGALHVLVKEARNLQTRAKHTGSCDPFCKSYLLPDKGRSGKQKTGVVRKSGGSPVWNHTFIYKDVSLQELAERGLELTVWDHDRIASNEFLGGVRFNLGTGKNYGKLVDWMDATGRELSLWQSMLERPNFWVEGAVTLRPHLHNHGKNGSF
ncbi:uncharacterized protein LOC117171527 isoform X2 [Belonocnema kinseyi]|uniref:uncharacterized protein LOC117171527 isoform X2 n=1 Tax=Belonocnema kinseyi TaxID=2817044 RepID=UPI00143D954C|nr:uncharacterized protein LOC117171527 isoform X2 [Belonocnema kinseyi]